VEGQLQATLVPLCSNCDAPMTPVVVLAVVVFVAELEVAAAVAAAAAAAAVAVAAVAVAVAAAAAAAAAAVVAAAGGMFLCQWGCVYMMFLRWECCHLERCPCLVPETHLQDNEMHKYIA